MLCAITNKRTWNSISYEEQNPDEEALFVAHDECPCLCAFSSFTVLAAFPVLDAALAVFPAV